MLCCLVCASYGAFDEDSYLFEAVELEAQNQFDKARDTYLVLYEETKKLEYLKEAILLSSMLDNPSATLDFANEYIAKGGEKDITMHKIFLDSYLKLGLSERAFEEAKIIAKSEDSPLLNDILGSLYASKGKFKEALEYLNKAYEQTKLQDVLQKIITIYLAQSRQDEALKALDTHIELYGCTGNFCKFSIDVYSRFSQVEKIEELFKRAFENAPTIENAQNLILIYAYQKKFKQASDIAAQFPFKPEVLLELYIAQEDYLNASLQAKYLYEEHKNPYFLALEQVYAFEALHNKQDIKQIKRIATNLQNALTLMRNPPKDTPKDSRVDVSLQHSQNSEIGFFLNFLGYLLIDYDIDVKEGVGHVKKALEISPQNPAYLDSLAWGYYKLKDCSAAREQFSLIPEDEIKKEQELQEHKKMIEKCGL
ncbi:ATP-dependent nuclease [Helicobacter jaachi]|uniref:ATP-dependent nuclease n=2 Tax=Helicobacter jaachi TaxID=1677920 RepID=A0A4U8TCL0_9HELI|nr:ATP-dependent nuclease [Helicobacter jaachi]